jgi:N-acetylmuramoyl-L-alanine amidase
LGFVLFVVTANLSWVQIGQAQCDVYIDPGHGGVVPDPFADPGCVTPIDRYFEKDVNLSVALEVKEWSDNYPGLFDAMYSRTTDSGMARSTRAYQTNGAGCHAFVSIHHNCFDPCPDSQYTVTLYSAWDTCVGGGNPWQGDPRDTTSLLARKLDYR